MPFAEQRQRQMRGPSAPPRQPGERHDQTECLVVWITVYVVIVGVALLHPRRSRRREARQILDCRLLVPRPL
ncbi:hypothetical protein ACIGW4_14560 [Streptomyces sp. NPDC053513]|uniref:hypothetical protein n=1 Tax=unclassified Streptomyces TaxID=2593676 RepID=UPI0037D8F524